jgi:hypothetical protein
MNIKKLEQQNAEYHIPGYNYCGPGTKVFTRLMRGDRGINNLDEACKRHDIEYMMYAGDSIKLQESDERLRKMARRFGGISAHLVDKIFHMKRILEDLKIISPSGFAMKLAKQMPISKQRRLGKLLYNKFILNIPNIIINEFF